MDNYVGKRLDGRYEIEEVIGVGGMAVVYKAYDSIDDRTVAVKILKEEYLANEEFRRRFKNESKAIAVLSHPNIVKVYDVSFGDRFQYIVMEYIEGIALKEYIGQRKVLDWNEALYFIIQVLRALQHAHDKGIVHRDIKPQNIMLLENGTIKVADFGIARFSHSETRTVSEKAIGSVHYMSPQQAMGEVTDEKADLYSVGVMLYEMLTGKLPFEAENAVSVALMQVQSEAALPRTVNPNIPIGFEQITMKAMQKHTKDRYQSAAEMLLDLEELKDNPSIKFDYPTYFVDNQATRPIGKIQTNVEEKPIEASPIMNAKTVEPKITKTAVSEFKVKAGEPQQSELVIQDAPKPKKSNAKIIAIIAGVCVAVLIGVIIIISSMIKNGTLTVGGVKNIKVDNFLGMNYENDIATNEELNEKFNFQIAYVASSEYPEGAVCNQSPSAGETVSKGYTISLSIVKSGESMVINDYTGLNYKQVQSELEALGFTVVTTAQTDSTKSVGQVVKTNPAGNTSVLLGSTITVYYAADASTGSLFKMPSLNGKSLSEAESILKKHELVLSKTEVSDSSIEKDYVLNQSPQAGSPVKKGDSVILTVSSGKVKGEKVITLPKDVGVLNVKTYLNNELVSSESVDSSKTTSYTVKVVGSGKENDIQVTLNDGVYYKTTADFSREQVRFGNGEYLALDFYVNVVGMKEQEAISKLKALGYSQSNIKVEYQFATSSLLMGTVVKQTPTYESAPHLDKSATVVLTVAKSDSGYVTQPNEPSTEAASTTAVANN